jgi:UDP-glucuronate 4-epimerase
LRHALVTGGAGFIGSHLIDRLLLEGCRVTVVDNAGRRDHDQYTLVEADIRDLDALRSRLDGSFDVIVHLAAKTGEKASIEDPLGFQEVNVRGTHNLLEMAREWGVKQFVFASSSSVYGMNPRMPWREEDTALLPISPDASTKACGELLGHVYSHLYGIRFVALRLFTVYGPRQRPDQAIHKFARRMLASKPIELFGKGQTRRDYTYVGDVVDGIRAAMEYGDLPYEVINLGTNQTISLCEMIVTLERALGVTAAIDRLPEQPGDVPQTWAQISKAQRLLGYHPRTSFAVGVARFAAWLSTQVDRDLQALNEALCEPGSHSRASLTSASAGRAEQGPETGEP